MNQSEPEAEMPKYKVSAFVLAIETYHHAFNSLVHEPENSLREFMAREYHVDVDFSFKIASGNSDAWTLVRNRSYDIYFIDAAMDGNVKAGRSFSDELRELFPGRPLVGMSTVGMHFKKDKVAKNYDLAIDGMHIGADVIGNILVDLCVIPTPKKVIDRDVDTEADRLMQDPKVARFMEEEGW